MNFEVIEFISDDMGYILEPKLKLSDIDEYFKIGTLPNVDINVERNHDNLTIIITPKDNKPIERNLLKKTNSADEFWYGS